MSTAETPVWEDPRIVRGQRIQLDARRALLDAGAKPVGWKVGMGTAQAQARIGTSGPIVGFLTDRTLLRSGAVVDLSGWAAPRLEPELAVRVGVDVPGGGSREEAHAAIEGMAVAIELIDLDPPAGGAEPLVAGNILHRHVLLGAFSPPAAPTRSTLRGGPGDGAGVVAESGDPTATPGDPGALVRHVADLLAASGELLRAGETVITGSIVAPQEVAPGTRWTHELAPFGAVAVAFA